MVVLVLLFRLAICRIAGCAAVRQMITAIGAVMVMIIFGDDDDGLDDQVDDADCDRLTEIDGGNADDPFEDFDDCLHFIF